MVRPSAPPGHHGDAPHPALAHLTPRGPAPIGVGSVIDQKYRLERQLGAGGMGEVFLATHLQLGRRVAIKFLRAQVLQNPELRERFRREAMAAATLVSEHIAQVFDVGELPGGAPFMVMEYLEGMDLSAWQQQRGLLSVVEAVGLLRQACAGLAVAHASRVVHRDLKPANLFLVPHASGPLLKILDFGVAKVPVASSYGTYIPPPSSDAGASALTSYEGALGSVRYMAPEQMESARDVDALADIWSLGVIAYRMLTGYFPFEAETMEEQFRAMITTRPRPLREYRADVPPGLDEVIARCLQVQREHRWPSAQALQAALAPFGLSPSGAQAAPSIAPFVPDLTPLWSDQKRTRGVVLAVLLASGAGVVGWQVFPALNAVRAVAAVAQGASEAAAQPAEAGAPNRVPLDVKNLSRVDPLDLLPTALQQARRLDPTVALERFSISGSFPADGALDMSGSSVVVFNFSTVSPKPRRVVVNVSAELGYLALEDRLNIEPERDPRPFGVPCSLARAMRAVVAQGGSPTAQYSAYYGLSEPGKWVIMEMNTRSHTEHMFGVDGASCVARKDL